MGKVLFGNGVAQIRGSIAGNTYSRNRGGSYIRNRVTPINPASARQESVRENLSALSKDWGAQLTEAQRDAWTAFAAEWPVTDVFGQTVVLTGEQMYVRLGVRATQAGLPVLAAAPLDQNVDTLLTLSGAFDVGVGSLAEATFTPTPLGAGQRLQLFATAPMPPGINFVKNRLRLLQTFAAATASPADFEAAYLARFGSPLEDQKVVIECRVINGANMAVSQPLRADIIVIST